MNINCPEDKSQTDQLIARGLEAHKANDLQSARLFYDQAIKINPHCADALHLLGMVADAEGDSPAAIQLIEAAINNSPTIAVYHNNLGNIFFKTGNNKSAEKCFINALLINPRYVEAKFNLASVFLEKNSISSAQNLYQEILSECPDFVPAINNLVETFLLQENLSAAYECLKNRECVRQNSELSEKYHEIMLICVAQESNQRKKTELMENIIKIDANNIDVKFNLANMYKNSGEVDNATSYYEEILQQDTNYFGALVNSGVIEIWCGRFESALNKFEAAYRINTNDYTLLNNLGMVHQALKNVRESQFFYEKAIALDNRKPEAYWNYSLLLLLVGEYEKGWLYYEYRWEIAEQLLAEKRNYKVPSWQGESLNGKTLYVYCEQGYGDSVQFSRYLLMLLDKQIHVVLECPKSLKSLFQNMHEKLELVSPDDNFTNFDYHVAMMSLPLVFRTRLSTIPNPASYLKTMVCDNEKWSALMQNKNGLNSVKKIGLVWAGNPRKHDLVNSLIDQRRSCQLSNFEPLLKINGLQFFSLQKDGQVLNEELNQITDCMNEVEDFYDTACIIQNLDLVISVDTAVAHLAAALGKPVWLLSRYDGCWRWLLNREDSPWYPSVRLFRQSESGGWGDVFERITVALQVFADNNS